MLHGFSTDHRLLLGCMEPILSHRNGWRRIYPDLPGMGMSRSQPIIENSDQMLDFLAEFIEAVAPGEHFVLAGQSYGGYLARGITYRMSNRMDGLLLICPLIFPDYTKRVLPQHVTIVKDTNLISSLTPEEAGNFEAIAVVQTREIWERYRDEVLAGVRIADQVSLTRLLGHFAFSFDVDRVSRPFEKPSLIIVGRQDSAVGYRDAWSILDNYPRCTFAILDSAGHNLQIEQEDPVHALVNEWLERVERVSRRPP